MIRLYFKREYVRKPAGDEHGGEFAPKRGGAAKTPVKASTKALAKAPAKSSSAAARDSVSEKLFNGKKILLDGRFDLRSPQRREIIDNHPDFKGLNEIQVQQKVVSGLFGKPEMTSKDYAKLVGAPDGSHVFVYVTMFRHSADPNHIVYEAEITTEHKTLTSKRVVTSFEWQTDSKKFDTPQRALEQAGFDSKTFPQGKRITTMYNENFTSHAAPGSGIGVRSFSTMAKHAEEYNISAAYTAAAGSKASPDYNGYYTWPRLGYDHVPRPPATVQGIMQDRHAAYVRGRVHSIDVATPKPVTSAKSLSELMKTSQGRSDWQNYGNLVWAYFDMRKSSPQKAFLSAYLKEKGISV